MTEVEKLLTEKEVQFFVKGKDLLVTCFNPEHEDENPSMRIDRETGVFHCFGCGYKGSIFTRFNKYRNIFNSRVRDVQNMIADIRLVSWPGYSLPEDAYFLTNEFRNIPLEILTKFDAHLTKEMGMVDRVVFPISDNRGIIVGFQGRYKDSDATPKYLMYPAEVSLPWYPAINKITMINSSIVLTEGLLDALYLHGRGITNAVTIFGTKSVTLDRVLELLTPYMLAGLQKVYLLMDGDRAGIHAADNIRSMIKFKTDLLIEILPIEEGKDPATLTDKEINIILKYIERN